MAFRDETTKFYGQIRSYDTLSQAESFLPDRNLPYSSSSHLLTLLEGTGYGVGSPCAPPSLSVEEESMCFFFHNWILSVSRTSQGGTSTTSFFEDIPSMLHDPSRNRLLRHTVVCLGKAGLAIHKRSSTTKLAAEADYAVALRLTNRALGNENEVKSDQTLIAVMLLGIYEASPLNYPFYHATFQQRLR
jgi:hypothetical protein